MRVIHAAGDPETSTILFGQKLSVPILGAVSGRRQDELPGIVSEEGVM